MEAKLVWQYVGMLREIRRNRLVLKGSQGQVFAGYLEWRMNVWTQLFDIGASVQLVVIQISNYRYMPSPYNEPALSGPRMVRLA